jgi:hypothetical protein
MKNEDIGCNEHPDAPHGFMRDASHSAGRYVCECESWEPPKREWVGLTDEEMKKVHTETGITYLVPADYDHHLFTHITDLQIMKVSRAIEAKLKEKNT